MKFSGLLSAGMLATMIASPMVMAETSLSVEQKKEVEQIVHDYLVSNPEVLVEASQALQQKQQKGMQEQAKSAILENADQLFTEKLAVTGNLSGNVTIVEFFDYQCIHCKKMNPVISDVVSKNKNVRVIYKEFPIFGKSSEMASEVALAAAMQGKYKPMHDALLNIEKRLDETIIMDAAKSVGLNMDQLKKDMKSKVVTDELDANRKLAEKLHLMGTPAFIVAATPAGKFKADSEPAFIPGAASQETLQGLIEKAAAGK